MLRLGCLLITAAALTACAAPESPARLRANAPIDDASLVMVATLPPGATRPRLISGRTPLYPISDVLSGASGFAEVEFRIDIEGRTRGHRVVAATNSRFADHAVIAIRDWRFEPATYRQEPIETTVRINLVFQGR